MKDKDVKHPSTILVLQDARKRRAEESITGVAGRWGRQRGRGIPRSGPSFDQDTESLPTPSSNQGGNGLSEERLESKDAVLADERDRIGAAEVAAREAASHPKQEEHESSMQQSDGPSQNGHAYQEDGEMSMELFGVHRDGSGLWRVDESSRSGGNGRPAASDGAAAPDDGRGDGAAEGRPEESSSDEEGAGFQGDMCSSTTGVVRLQSRRKAEMYLVRTDGFTCTREKVRESTLAFTHPSTQQQMLMWKTPPKTVMLLKKLGDDLMKETEEVSARPSRSLLGVEVSRVPLCYCVRSNPHDADSCLALTASTTTPGNAFSIAFSWSVSVASCPVFDCPFSTGSSLIVHNRRTKLAQEPPQKRHWHVLRLPLGSPCQASLFARAQVALWLHHQEGMNVVVEPEVHDKLARTPGFGFVETYYNADMSRLHERVDFVVCLGGDGVILHVSNLFTEAVPPVVSFNLGSLGFLTTHQVREI